MDLMEVLRAINLPGWQMVESYEQGGLYTGLFIHADTKTVLNILVGEADDDVAEAVHNGTCEF